MRKMGGIWRAIPITYGLMWTGSLALAGMPFLAGFYSKDIIIESAFAAATGVGQYAFWLGVIVAALTAFYSWRLILMTFHGAPRADEKVMAHVHEAPKTMWIPMVVLAVGAIVMGKLGFDVFVGEGARAFWRDSIVVLPAHTALEDAHDVPLWVKLLPLVVALGGIILAYIFYMFRPALPGLVAGRFRGLYSFLVNKWYFDAIYDRVFVSPANAIGLGFWKSGDGAVIDGIGPDGLAAATRELARLAGRLQSGYVYHYAFAMLIGVAGLVSWYLFQQAG